MPRTQREKTLMLLTPGGAAEVYEQTRLARSNAEGSHVLYRFLSSIKEAMRSRAVDHKRSMVRGETSKVSAVSSVERPAK